MAIRPTSDRLRETLFNVLCGGNPGHLAGSRWLDLYAGTGAVGVEALSRGAAHVTFVENSRKAAAMIENNLRSLGIAEGFTVMPMDAVTAVRRLAASGGVVDYAFLDPPYRLEEEYGETLRGLVQVVNNSSIVIAEHDRKFDPGESVGALKRYRKLQQGDSALTFYRVR